MGRSLASPARRLTSGDITGYLGHVAEFCGNQYGSRFIQQKLECLTDEDKKAILSELVLIGPLSLMPDACLAPCKCGLHRFSTVLMSSQPGTAKTL